MKNEIKEEYSINLSLEILYDIIDSLYMRNKENYPDKVNDMLLSLLKIVASYNDNSKKGYSIVNEKIYSTITYKKD